MSSSDFYNTDVYKQGNSNELIVFVHGYGPFAKRHLRAIAKVITGKRIDISTPWDRIEAVLAFFLLVVFCGVAFWVPFVLWSGLHPSDLSSWGGLAKFVVALVLTAVAALLSFGLVVIALIIFILRVSGSSGTSDDVETGGEETGNENDSLGFVIHSVATETPDADLLVPFYDAAIFSNADVFLLASRLDEAIQKAFEDREKRGGHYEKIVLIGHSIGALLVRKAYVYGCGATEDHPVHQRPTDQKPWVKFVDRVILLAPMNRGWSIWPRPKHMSRIKLCFYSFVMATGKFTGRARLLRSLRRGTQFVSNLRLQWIRLCRERADEVAPLILLLGDTDDMVSQEDHQDVSASAKFIFIPVPSSGHASIVKFQKREKGNIRRRKFLKALTETVPTIQREFRTSTQEVRESPVEIRNAHSGSDLREVGDVIFVLHGIRDFAHWTQTVKDAIKRQNPGVQVITSGYGYFPIFRFLLFGSRQRNVQLFMDWYTEAIASNPDREVSFIGHSNGTYILASALTNYVTLKIKFAAFAGSIIPRNFPWERYKRDKRIMAIRNDVAADDRIVGIFGRFFELFNENLGVTYGSFGDIGSSGFHGFTSDCAHEQEHKYFPGGHGAALTTANYESLARFLVSGVSEVNPTCLVTRQSRILVLCSKFSILIFAILIALTAFVGYGIVGFLETVMGVGLAVSWLAFLLCLFVFLSLF